MESQRGPGRPRKNPPSDQQNDGKSYECCETCFSHRENKSNSMFVKGQVICHYFPESIPRQRDHWCRQWEPIQGFELATGVVVEKNPESEPAV